MNEALKTVVRAYQADVQRGLAVFRQYKGSDEADHARDHSVTDPAVGWHGCMRAWQGLRSRVDSSRGYLDADRRLQYAFHGIGLTVQLAPEYHIDWDVGHGGRMDGFDESHLQYLLRKRPEFQRILPLDSFREVFDAAVRDGSIVSPWRAQGDPLYYIADDVRSTNRPGA